MTDHHCNDCCCAKSWEALGVTEYTGRSIPEHISEIRAEIDRLQAIVDKLTYNGVFTPDHVRSYLDSFGCESCGVSILDEADGIGSLMCCECANSTAAEQAKENGK